MRKRVLVLVEVAAALAFATVDVPSPQGRWQGAIDLPGQTLDVVIRSDQPPYHLEPYRGTEFRFKIAGCSIRFLPEAGEILVIQPDGVYRGKRKAS